MSAKKKDKNRSEDSQPQITIVQRQIIFDEDFREDLQWWYRQDAQKANKILDLVESICIDPFSGTGKPEPSHDHLLKVRRNRPKLANKLGDLVGVGLFPEVGFEGIRSASSSSPTGL